MSRQQNRILKQCCDGHYGVFAKQQQRTQEAGGVLSITLDIGKLPTNADEWTPVKL